MYSNCVYNGHDAMRQDMSKDNKTQLNPLHIYILFTPDVA